MLGKNEKNAKTPKKQNFAKGEWNAKRQTTKKTQRLR